MELPFLVRVRGVAESRVARKGTLPYFYLQSFFQLFTLTVVENLVLLRLLSFH
jgi:hypothetical protein